MAANGLLALDLFLSTPSLVDALQDQDGTGSWPLRLLLAPQGSEGGPTYGLSLAFGIGIGAALLVSMVLVGFVQGGWL